MDIVIGIILIAAGLFLIGVVLLQSNKDKGLSGALAGNTDTYYGKNKAKDADKLLSRITMVVAIVFAVLVLVSFVIQDDQDLEDLANQLKDQATATESVTTEDVSDTEADSVSDTEADSEADTENEGTDTES
ncbi:MAG: preprotein translocase subunit SecG [Ruminococcaceae bacterium]|nr:preprotein translocase subunit SecG [Oscillospiraceae bacterium]